MRPDSRRVKQVGIKLSRVNMVVLFFYSFFLSKVFPTEYLKISQKKKENFKFSDSTCAERQGARRVRNMV